MDELAVLLVGKTEWVFLDADSRGESARGSLPLSPSGIATIISELVSMVGTTDDALSPVTLARNAGQLRVLDPLDPRD